MTEYILDTHPLIFRFSDPGQLGSAAKKAFLDSTSTFLVPTMALLEVQYLIEIGRVKPQIGDLIRRIEQHETMRIVAFAESELLAAVVDNGSRDPFDRIILATAQARRAPLITRDRWMKSVYPQTIW